MKKYEIEINNEVYRVSVKELPADTDMTSPQTRPAMTTSTAAAAPAANHQTTPQDQSRPTEVKAPMAGTIFKVPVTSGQAVSKGDTLIILEAMKMENEIVAPTDGIVGEIFVSPNDPVQSDQLLLTI